MGAVRLDSAECATTNSRKFWDGRATESSGTKSMKSPRPCVYGCGASGEPETGLFGMRTKV